MRPVWHYEVPHLALWKSAVSRVVARAEGTSRTNAAGSDSTHPMMQAADHYCRQMEGGAPPPEPSRGDHDLDIQAWLHWQHHRKAHAKTAGDTALQAQIDRQTADFTYGNPLWQQMYVEYYRYYWQYPYHKGGEPKYRSWKDPAFGNGNLDYGAIDWRLPPDAKVAIVGDIGTGTDVAAAVLTAALSFAPDAILHVGDVYYSGTDFEVRHRLVGLVRDVMRAAGRRVPFFTVPGNHEYFTGNVALLAALDGNKLVCDERQRQRASYFRLRTADDGWQFLGMDTAYHGHYMNVAKGASQATLDYLHIGGVQTDPSASAHWPKGRNPYFAKATGADLPVEDTTSPDPQVLLRDDEVEWQRHQLETFSGRSILLSHHQLYSALDVCGIAQRAGADGQPDPTDLNRAWVDTALWQQLGPAFGDRVAAWIWGHEHNLGIFESAYRPAGWPADDPVYRTLPKGRCAGHAAIPVAESEGPYVQKYPVNLESGDPRLAVTDGWYNHGFELLRLGGRGRPAVTEYYQVAGADPTPILVFSEEIV